MNFILNCFNLTNIYGKEKISTLRSKNKVADEKKLVQSGFLKKNRQMKVGQNNKCDITKTPGLVQVCFGPNLKKML